MMQVNDRSMAGLSRFFVPVSLLLLALALEPPVAVAQDTQAVIDPYPLQPADTSTPRATLRSFLTNTKEGIADRLRRGKWTKANYRAHYRALETLDFSSTPHSDSRFVRSQRLVLLMEILGRVELPTDTEIPGDDEVADGAITQWTIPNTRVVIKRVEGGPRGGEFLFSADTVQRLDRLYRHAKDLPYKPGASLGIYEDFFGSDLTAHARESRVRNRLKPVDTSNPRSTLDGFLDSVNRAYAIIMEAQAALKATPRTMTAEEARETEVAAENLLGRAMATLDLSQVPEVLRHDIGLETVLQLKEVIDRMMLPPLDTVPDARVVAAARRGEIESFSPAAGPLRWRYPNTEIDIVEITEGEGQGQFLFSAATVSRAKDFYEQVRDLPYRTADAAALAEEYLSPGKSENFFEYYIATPGYLVPGANPFAGWVEDLPDWLKTLRGGQTVWQWIAVFLSVLAFFLAAYVTFRVTRRLARGLSSPWDGWLSVLTPTIVAFITFAAVRFLDSDINVTGYVLSSVTTGGQTIVFAMMAWAVYVLCKAIAETIIASPRIRDQGIDASLLRIGGRVVGFLIGAWILIGGVRHLGADMVPLLAGLGVGGLAVALAAQSTIANFIGSLILFANRPVRVGDFCRYGEDPSPGWLRIGTVEEIGLISTRLRGIDRTVTTIPNAEFANMHIVNLTKRDRMVFRPTLALRSDTTGDQLRVLCARLRELLLAHPRVTHDPARVRFAGFGNYSLNVEIFAYVNTGDWNEFLAIREDLQYRILDIVEAAGTAFAIPSRLYHTRDGGIDDERQQAAAKQVREWAAGQVLPFPDFPDEYREQIVDTLDYPPDGSPGANRG